MSDTGAQGEVCSACQCGMGQGLLCLVMCAQDLFCVTVGPRARFIVTLGRGMKFALPDIGFPPSRIVEIQLWVH